MSHIQVVRMFYDYTQEKGLEVFTADDFRDSGIEKHMKGTAKGSIGGFFTNSLRYGYIEKTGQRVKGKFRRDIFEYRWTSKIDAFKQTML